MFTSLLTGAPNRPVHPIAYQFHAKPESKSWRRSRRVQRLAGISLAASV